MGDHRRDGSAVVGALRAFFAIWRSSRRERVPFVDALQRARQVAHGDLTDEEREAVRRFDDARAAQKRRS